MLGERRHKDELDSGDDSDHGRDQDDVSLGFYYMWSHASSVRIVASKHKKIILTISYGKMNQKIFIIIAILERFSKFSTNLH